MTRIFVYGTLKRGCCNHHYLHGQRYLGDARTVPGYALYRIDYYPGMVRDTAGERVEGEVWGVDTTCLAELDRLEGLEEGLYAREVVPLEGAFAETPVDGYIFLRPVDPDARLGPNWTE